jgi:hypothetical protein
MEYSWNWWITGNHFGRLWAADCTDADDGNRGRVIRGWSSFLSGISEDYATLYFVACTGAMLWNLWLSKYRKIRIGILFMPAWAFGIMGMVLAPIAHFAGWE